MNFNKIGVVKTLSGTILAPQHGGLKLVLSVMRVDGKLENPLLDLFSKRWVGFKKEIANVFAIRTGDYKLGYVPAPYAVQSDVWIMHCVTINEKGKLDLDAFRKCLKSIVKTVKDERASVHISNILVTKFPKISKLLEEELTNNGVNIYYYNEPN